MLSAHRPSARWALPAGAVVAVAAVIAGMTAAGAQAAPRLPARSAAQLLASVARARGPVPLTGTFTETASLGLPSLPGGGDGPLGGLAALSGTHTYQLWLADAQHLRISEPVQLGESDLRRDGSQVWLWDSMTQVATHVILPALAGHRPSPKPEPAPPLTPQQAARQILAAVGPTTTVSVQPDVTVAGQPAYQLALAPKDSRSLVGQVRIAIDAAHALPLRVQVFARGATAPAFQAGYTTLAFGRPAASNFSFTPPRGATVKTITPGWHGSTGVPSGQGAAGSTGGPPGMGPGAAQGRPPGPDPGRFFAVTPQRPAAVGSGWLTVLVLPASATAQPTASLSAIREGHGKIIGYRSVTIVAATGAVATPGPAALRVLERAATPVHGAWGSGRLLRTSLLSVLFTSDGTILVGAVTPAVLYADAAAAR